MNAALVVVTFLAGNAWGPQVTTMDMPGLDTCNAARASVAAQIARTARTNITGGEASVGMDDLYTVVTGPSGREMARLSCLGAGGRLAR